MATGQVKDPYRNFNFLVEIDGIARAAFQQCSGIDATTEVIEHREGGDNLTSRKLPGRTKYSNISLKWGLMDDRELYDWHRRIAQGEIERKNGSIVLLNRRGEEVARWNFMRAWPTVWHGSELNAEEGKIAVETMELAHEGVERA